MNEDWGTYLEAFRAEETARAFRGCPEKVFDRGLELGAGSGTQSRYIAAYVRSLVSTDLNSNRLVRGSFPGIEYQICDAERVGERFSPASFDLVFASNLFEHLLSPQRALEGIRTVLAPGGIVILVMPNALWKFFSLVGFYPNAVRLMWRALVRGRLRVLMRRYLKSNADAAHEKRVGNNLKSEEARSHRSGILWPVPHGAYATHRDEFRQYRKRRWLREFENAGFETVAVRRGPVSSGYGFGLRPLARLLEMIGVTTEYIYILHVRGTASAYARYWRSQNPTMDES